MCRTIIEEAAFAMQLAYKTCPKMVDAIAKVQTDEDFRKVPYGILQGMWLGIDAYVSTNPYANLTLRSNK